MQYFKESDNGTNTVMLKHLLKINWDKLVKYTMLKVFLFLRLHIIVNIWTTTEHEIFMILWTFY